MISFESQPSGANDANFHERSSGGSSSGSARWRARRSPIHGTGVFCLRPIRSGEIIGRYAGRVLSAEEAAYLEEDRAGHTFLFELSDGRIIDGGDGGNGTRFLNHSCEPNCEAEEDDRGILIRALRDLSPGEELTFDYRLSSEDPDAAAAHPCRCGSASCRGTLIWDARHLEPS